MKNYPQLFLNTRKAGSFLGQHPWVLEKSIIDPTVPLEPGTIVDLMHPKGHWIGRGVYNPLSRIRVRLYQWDQAADLDDAWLRGQLDSAVAMRESWQQVHGPLDAVRLVNSEGDGLSGLVIDKFLNYIVVQVSAIAMQRWSSVIVEWLQTRFQPDAIFVRTDQKTVANEGTEDRDEVIGLVPDQPIELNECGVRIQLDLASGQKTGYYLDQRSNRMRAAQWVQPGAMLDVCSYLGGFSLAACRWGKPTSVLALDSSKRALEQAATNASLNGFTQISFEQADCFERLGQMQKSGDKFQTIVLDPPRMASNRGNVAAALRAYHRLNSLALELLLPGGILVTCSCSGRVSREEFAGVLSAVASRQRRSVQIIESLGADFDHPISTNCPESEYLKCFICRAK
jgi:23S rRNA (cytosine1962-C5)-methyltransferase